MDGGTLEERKRVTVIKSMINELKIFIEIATSTFLTILLLVHFLVFYFFLNFIYCFMSTFVVNQRYIIYINSKHKT